jgi:hypothetical protein
LAKSAVPANTPSFASKVIPLRRNLWIRDIFQIKKIGEFKVGEKFYRLYDFHFDDSSESCTLLNLMLICFIKLLQKSFGTGAFPIPNQDFVFDRNAQHNEYSL